MEPDNATRKRSSKSQGFKKKKKNRKKKNRRLMKCSNCKRNWTKKKLQAALIGQVFVIRNKAAQEILQHLKYLHILLEFL